MNQEKSKLYKQVFGSAEGKKVLKDLMDFGNVLGQTHVPNDPHSSAFNEGQRRTVLRILSFLKPEEIVEINNDRANSINTSEGYYE